MLPETQNKINKNYEAAIKLLREIMADSSDHPRFDEILRVHNEIITEKSAYLIAAYQETGNENFMRKAQGMEA